MNMSETENPARWDGAYIANLLIEANLFAEILSLSLSLSLSRLVLLL